MEPTTAIAIAQIAYGIFNKPSSKDTMDALVNMLAAIEKELNIIKDQLDVILAEITTIPDKTFYKLKISDLMGVLEQAPVHYRNYNSAISKSPRFGRNRFVEEYETVIKEEFRILHSTFHAIKGSPDALTINYICSAIHTFYSISTLIEDDITDINNQLDVYREYLTHVLYGNQSSSLKSQIANMNSLIQTSKTEIFQKHSYSEKKEVSYGGGGGREGDGKSYKWETTKAAINFYRWTPVLTKKKLSSAETNLIGRLYDLGYLESSDILEFQQLVQTSSDEKAFMKSAIKCESSLHKTEDRWKKEDVKEVKCGVLDKAKAERKKNLDEGQATLIALSATTENATTTLNKLIKIIGS